MLLALRAQQALRVQQVLKATKEYKVPQDHREFRALQALQGTLEPLGTQVLQVT